jgi:DDE superfamily endonuclease
MCLPDDVEDRNATAPPNLRERQLILYAIALGVTPQTVTTDQAAAYPPALAEVLPEVEHITGKAEQQRIERDHQHLTRKTPGLPWVPDRKGSTAILSGPWFRPEPPPGLLPARVGPAECEGCPPATTGPSLGGTHGSVAGLVAQSTRHPERFTAGADSTIVIHPCIPQ